MWWVPRSTGQILKKEGVIAESNARGDSDEIISTCLLESVEVGWFDDLSKSSLWRGRERRWFVGCQRVKKGEEGKLRVQTLHCINPLFTGKESPRRTHTLKLEGEPEAIVGVWFTGEEEAGGLFHRSVLSGKREPLLLRMKGWGPEERPHPFVEKNLGSDITIASWHGTHSWFDLEQVA